MSLDSNCVVETGFGTRDREDGAEDLVSNLALYRRSKHTIETIESPIVHDNVHENVQSMPWTYQKQLLHDKRKQHFGRSIFLFLKEKIDILGSRTKSHNIPFGGTGKRCTKWNVLSLIERERERKEGPETPQKKTAFKGILGGL